MRDLPTGTITLLFRDIEGSTRLLQQVGDRYAEVLNECRSLLRSAFHEYRGHEVDTQGDAIFAAFARASDALLAAVAAQRALTAHSWPDGVTVCVRMGLHTGEPSRVAFGPEWAKTSRRDSRRRYCRSRCCFPCSGKASEYKH